MKIEPFESQETQEKRITTAEEDIAALEAAIDDIEKLVNSMMLRLTGKSTTIANIDRSKFRSVFSTK